MEKLHENIPAILENKVIIIKTKLPESEVKNLINAGFEKGIKLLKYKTVNSITFIMLEVRI